MTTHTSLRFERNVHFKQTWRGRKQMAVGEAPAPASVPLGRVPRLARLMALAIRFDGLLQRGEVRDFPCLQQVGVSHDGGNMIAINAYYPTQYIFDRAYGNYLGLCHLGAFIAHEAGKRFVRLNCFIGAPNLGNITKHDVKPLLAVVDRALAEHATTEVHA